MPLAFPLSLLIFAQSTTLLFPLTVVFGASINGRRHSHAGHQEEPLIASRRSTSLVKCALRNAKIAAPGRGAALEPIRRLLARRPRGNSATSIKPITARHLMDRFTGEVVARRLSASTNRQLMG